MSKAPGIIVVLLAAQLGGCVTYREFPEDNVGQRSPRPAATAPVHYYSIKNGTLGSGKEALYDALKRRSPYSRGQHTEKPPAQGIYVEARIEPLLPSVPAIGAAYLSVSTLTLLPAWSTRDGYLVIFSLSRDGAPLQSFEYKARRKAFLWLGFLPLIWVNALTYSEDEVFTAIADQFFADAAPLFSAPAGTPGR